MSGNLSKKMHNTRVMFPSSSGGHITEILQLKKLFAAYEYLIVTEDLPLNKKILAGMNVEYVKPNGMNRNFVFWKNFIVNWFLALKLIIQFRPHVIVTTGSHTAVPFCYLGKLFGAKVIFILSFCRLDSRAKSADLVYPIADKFFLQWPQMDKFYKNGIYVGPIF